MRELKYIIILFVLVSSCIEKFQPKNVDTSKLVVVDAVITDESENQSVRLSWSSNTVTPFWDPIPNADVIVVDKGGNIYEFTESNSYKGIYEGTIPIENIIEGNAFKISFTTHEGKDYESEFDEFLACPEVDTVYYEIDNEHFVGSNSVPERGIEFFIDLKANKNYTSYYRWSLIETYEHRATWPIETYFAGDFFTHPPDFSLYFCYVTEPVYQIFSATTINLDENLYLKYPFHFVNNHTQKLYYRYSLLVKQNAISEKAYNYWEKLKDNNQASGGLFDGQPQQIRGNVVCLSNPDEPVLGYFGVSGVRVQRIFITRNDLSGDLIYDYDVFCDRYKPDKLDFITNSPEESWPIYMAPPPEDDNGLWYAQQHCFDCRLYGGVLELPEFWH